MRLVTVLAYHDEECSMFRLWIMTLNRYDRTDTWRTTMSGLGVDLGHAFNNVKKIGEILSYLQSQSCPNRFMQGLF